MGPLIGSILSLGSGLIGVLGAWTKAKFTKEAFDKKMELEAYKSKLELDRVLANADAESERNSRYTLWDDIIKLQVLGFPVYAFFDKEGAERVLEVFNQFPLWFIIMYFIVIVVVLGARSVLGNVAAIVTGGRIGFSPNKERENVTSSAKPRAKRTRRSKTKG